MGARRQKPETAVGDLFGGRPEDLAAVRAAIRELNWQLRHWQAEWPRWIDRRYGSPALTKDVAEARLAVLAKALAHYQALEGYLLDRSQLVQDVGALIVGPAFLQDFAEHPEILASMRRKANDVLQLVEGALRLGATRPGQLTPPAGSPAAARGASFLG